MKVSERGLMALVRHEGVVQSRYKDAVGVWTIGVGHTKMAGGVDPRRVTRTLSMAEVFEILREDIVKYERGVMRAIKKPMEQHEFDAFVSFHFNTGAIAKASLTKHFNRGNKAACAKSFMNWTKGGGKVLSALVTRRKEERAMFSRGHYPAPVATVYPATASGRVQWAEGKRVNVANLLADTAPVSAKKPPPPPKQPEKKPSPSQPASGGFSFGKWLISLFGRN